MVRSPTNGLNGKKAKLVIPVSIAGIGAAATLLVTIAGVPVPEPAWKVDLDELRQQHDQDIAALRRDVDLDFRDVNTRLSGIERRQIEAILVSLRSDLRRVNREIEQFQEKGISTPPSALREKDRLEATIRRYENILLRSEQ